MVSDPNKGQLPPFTFKNIVLKAVLPDMFGSVRPVGSYIGVNTDTTPMFSFSGAALQICLSKRVERGESENVRQNEENCCQRISFGKGEPRAFVTLTCNGKGSPLAEPHL